MARRAIYNLEFPSWCPEFTIGDYHFTRHPEYEQQLQRLQHFVEFHAEFSVKPNTGIHAITAYIELPDHESDAVLEWSGSGNTALMDVLLLLSLFTGRDVFAGEPFDENNGEEELEVIIRDSRIYSFGGILQTSIPYKGKELDEFLEYNIGFEEELNRILLLLRSEEWTKEYGGGYFLLLARQAFHRHTIETSFILCWAIWEHLFALHNQKWLSNRRIHNLSGDEKIAYLLVRYALQEEIDEKSRSRISDLAAIRNRLIHFGRFPEQDKVHDDAVLFVRLTEFIVAKILGLRPSNVFNTVESLEEFLERTKTS